MAKSFLSKFNTLLQANVRGALRGGGSVEPGEVIVELRHQFETAKQEQAAMERDIAGLDGEIRQLDAQADDALRAGRNAEARHVIEHIERMRRKRSMMQSEHDDYQRALGQLLVQINQVEALTEPAAQPAESNNAPAQQSLSDAIRQARQTAASTRRIQVEIEDEASQDDEVVEQELAARRARLAKPD